MEFLEGRGSGKKRTILLVEDEALIAMNQAAVLEKHGFSVRTVYSGEQAIEAAGETGLDLILMDIDLGRGKMDGTQTAEVILKDHNIPLVFLSSHTEPEIVAKTEKITSYGYVVKDSGETVLIASIKMAFRLHEAYRERLEKSSQLNTLLTQAEKELQNVINSISDGMAVIDRDFNILRTNKALLDDIGAEVNSELLGEKCYAAFYGRDTFCEWCPAKEVFRTGREQSITVPFPAENPVRWFDLKASPVRNSRGEVVQVVEVARDLTEQKKIEEALTSSEKQKDVILNATAEMVAYYDTNLKVIWTNRTSAESVGESVENLVGLHCYEVWQGRSEPCVGCPVLNVLETGKPQSAEQHTPDGKYWYIRGYPVFDEKGNVSNLVEFGQDITEQKIHEERLAALIKLNEMDSANQDELAEFALEESVRLTRSEIGFINFLSEDEKHVTHAVYTQNTLKQCRLPENVSAFEISGCGLWSEAYRKRRPVIVNDYKMPHPSKVGFPEGHPVLRRFISIPIFEGDRIVAVAALGNKETEYNDRDVKELRLFIEGFEQIIVRKKMEKQLRSSLAEKDSLMAELNHRVKNNLAILSSLINLKNSALGNSVDLSDIKHQIDAVRIVHDKLYKSSDITHIELRDYLQDLLTTVFSSFSAMAVEIENRIEDVRMPTRQGVPVGLITNEIATNAIKYGFAKDKKARFTVDLSVDEEEGQYILVLSNTGNPFPEDIDLDNPETLGLRLISALVSQLGGTIELKRNPSPRYTIRFPK